jgi:hypothetical protein
VQLVSTFLSRLRATARKIVGEPTQLDYALKAMDLKASAPLRPRRPPSRMRRWGPLIQVDVLQHRLPSRKGHTREVPLLYQRWFDGSKKYPVKRSAAWWPT